MIRWLFTYFECNFSAFQEKYLFFKLKMESRKCKCRNGYLHEKWNRQNGVQIPFETVTVDSG